MIDIEEQLSAGMRERTAGLALTTDVVVEARRRHRRRVAVQRVGYAAGAIGLAGALAAGVMIDGSGTPAPPSTPTVAAPQVQLASAIAASENISYRVKVTELYRGRVDGADAKPTIIEGAFDPATATGYLASRWTGAEGSVYYERLIDGVLYTGSSGGDGWKQDPGKHDGLRYARGGIGEVVGASADPEQLFDALRKSGAKITKSGADVYHFEFALKASVPARGKVEQSIAGDVTVAADNRIAKIAYAQTTVITKDGATHPPQVVDVTVELSGYGTPVKVEKPTDVVIVTG
jgi:hypothetical protein